MKYRGYEIAESGAIVEYWIVKDGKSIAGPFLSLISAEHGIDMLVSEADGHLHQVQQPLLLDVA